MKGKGLKAGRMKENRILKIKNRDAIKDIAIFFVPVEIKMIIMLLNQVYACMRNVMTKNEYGNNRNVNNDKVNYSRDRFSDDEINAVSGDSGDFNGSDLSSEVSV